MRMLNRILALVLVLSLGVGLLPTDGITAWIAEAEAQRSIEATVVAKDYRALLAEADAQVEMGRTRASGGWRYVAVDGGRYAAVVGYDGEAEAQLAVPELLGGMDVVAIGAGALASLAGLEALSVPGNVRAIGAGALPRGAAVKALNASYALAWAAQNGHAGINASEFDFHAGVVDLSDVREENFVRVSANEVWLRGLEASRLAVGKRFFLVDPGNAYQVSYYEVLSTDEGPDGFVVFRCATPEVDEVLDYYEAVNQAMVADLSTLETFASAELDEQTAQRSLSGSISTSLGFNVNTPKIDLGSLGKLKITGGYNVTWTDSFKVGLFVTNTASISQKDAFSINATLTKKLYEDAEMASGAEQAEKTVKKFLQYATEAGSTAKGLKDQLFSERDSYSFPLASVTVFSYAGIINAAATMHYTCEVTGELSVSFECSNTTTITWAEGQNPKKSTKPGVRKTTGKIEGEVKMGVEVSLELYVLIVKVITASAFVGLKATATFDLELKKNADGTVTNEFELFLYVLSLMKSKCDVDLAQQINLNMLDLIEIKVDFVVEVGLVVGIGDYITAFNSKVPLLDINFLTLHLHLFKYAYQLEPFTDGWETKTNFHYFFTGDKDNFHPDLDCPYDQKNVEVHKYDGSVLKRYLMDANSLFEEPIYTFDSDNRKLLRWHTDASLDRASIVHWPYKIVDDTAFFPETVPMHWLSMINGAGEYIYMGQRQHIYEVDEDGDLADIGKTLYARRSRLADQEFVDLPATLPDGSDVLWWVRVKDRDDLTPLDYNPNSNDWKLPAGGKFRMNPWYPEQVYLCAVTDKDVAAYFHTCVGGGCIPLYCRRGASLAAPACTATLPRYRFAGWLDEDGNAIGETFQTDEDSPSEIHFYANWEPSGETTAAEASDTYIGSIQYNYDDYVPADPAEAFSYSLQSSGIRINGLKSGYSFENLRIPEKIGDEFVTAIASEAFKGNQDLVSVTVPSSVSSIGGKAFASCPYLRQIDLSPSSVTSLPSEFASNCPALGRVLLPTGVKLQSIGDYAFRNCATLNCAKISSNIGVSAFVGCTGLTAVELAGGVKSIGNYAFDGCSSLASLNVPDSVTSLGVYFVRGCTGLTRLEIDASVDALSANHLDIGDGSQLSELVLGGTIRTLGEKLIANGDLGYPNLTHLTLPPMLFNVGSYLIRGSSVTDLTLSFAPFSLGLHYYAFADCQTLRTVTVRSGAIPAYAFLGDGALETVNLGASVSGIGDSAFSGCDALTTVNIESTEGSALRTVGYYAFKDCLSLASLAFPKSVKSYGAGMIQGCTGLKNLSLSGVKGLKLDVPSGSNSSDVTNPFFIGEGATLENLSIGGGIRKIGANAFANAPNRSSTTRYGFPSLQTLTLGDSVADIGEYAFYKAGMGSLELSAQVSFARSAFARCDNLTHVVLENANNSANLFEACPNLTSVEVRGGEIGDYAFSGCSGLTELTLGERVTMIGKGAFKNCAGLTRLTIPDSVTSYGADMIEGCTNLEYLYVGGGVSRWPDMNTSYSYSTDHYNPFFIGEGSKLKTLVIGEGVTEIGKWRFANAFNDYPYENRKAFPELETVVLPSTLRRVGTGAFWGAKLKTVKLKYCDLAASAFGGMTTLEEVSLEGGEIGDSAFQGCTGLKRVVLGDGVTGVGKSAFKDCVSLTSLTLPDSVTSYGADMIEGCTNLEYLYVGGGVSRWPDMNTSSLYRTDHYNPFFVGEGSKLKTLVIGEGVTEIGKWRFANAFNDYSYENRWTFPELETVVLPSTLTSLGTGNLSAWKKVAFVKLSSDFASLTDSGSLPSGLTLFSDEYNEVIADFAAQKGVAYEVGSGNVPSYTLVCAAPAALLANGAETVDGVDGLPEGFVALSSRSVPYGQAVEPDAPPVAAGCVFRGWTTDPGHAVPWTLGAMPPVDLTLYARIEPAPGTVNVDYAICSDAQGTADPALPEGFRRLARYARLPGEPVPVPGSVPERPGYRFTGWFANPEGTLPWVLTDVPDGGATIYAGYERLVRVTYAVNLAAAGTPDAALPAGFARYLVVEQALDSAMAYPAAPAVEGYVFEGWYTDPDFKTVSSYRTVTLDDLTLYGKLSRLAPGGRYRAVSGGVELVRFQLEEGADTELHLPSVVNGQPVVSIAARAFEGSGIDRLYLPDSLVSVSPDAFKGSGILSVNIGKGAAHFTTLGGALYDKEVTRLIYYPAAKRNTSYVMPDTVTVVSPHAVEDSVNLRQIQFSSALTEIGQQAFSGCTALREVALPDSCAVLRAGAFSGCTAIATFTAYGLQTIDGVALEPGSGGSTAVTGQKLETIPRYTGTAVYGPVATGVLRDWFTCTLSDGTRTVLQYNQYPLTLDLDGERESLGNEAGMTLLSDIAEVTFDDGSFVEAWYTDAEMTQPWDLARDRMPAEALTLYGTRKPLFSYESGEVDGVYGLILTDYSGRASALTVPAALNGQAVVGIGGGFLAGGCTVQRLTVGSHIRSIDESAMAGFTGTVVCDADSVAMAWAEARGLDTEVLLYTLTLISEGESIEPRRAAKGAWLRLPQLTNSYRGFTGWTTDIQRTNPVALDADGFYAMPGADTTLYAAWDAGDEVVPFTWTAVAGEVTVTGYTGESPDVVIPATINGWPVTAIAAEAFAGSALQSVDLGGVVEVGEGAFENCARLRALTLPNALAHIGDRAFAGCVALSSVTLPDGLAALGEQAFARCTGLKTLNLGAGIARFAPNAVDGCVRLSAVNAASANGALSSLDGVLFDEAATRLIFYPQGRSEAVYAIPDGVTAVGDGAFARATQLTRVTVPATVTDIGRGAFQGAGLTGFAAAGLLHIGANAFFGCANLMSVEPGNALEDIGDGAFAGCDALTDIHIPESATLETEDVLFTNPGVVITGRLNSSAHAYALANDLLFNDPQGNPVTSVTLSQESALLKRGESLQLSAATLPADADFGANLYWISSDERVAIVDENGRVSALGGGVATITAITGNGLSAACAVEVQVDVVSLAFDAQDLYLLPGESAQPELALEPFSATDKTLTWTSSDTDVAQVDADGVIHALAAGEAVVTVAASNGVSAQLTAKVRVPIEALTLSEPEQALYAVEGRNVLQLGWSIEPENGTHASPVWTSSDAEVLTVDADGVVTAHAPGKATVTGTIPDDCGATDALTLTVLAMDLSEAEIALSPFTYNGQAQQPGAADVQVTLDGRALEAGADYTLTADAGVDAGEYALTVCGVGSYCGERAGTFTIEKATPVIALNPAERYWPDTLEIVQSVEPDAEWSIEYTLIAPDGARVEKGAFPDETGEYEVTVSVAESDNLFAATAVKRLHYQASEEIYAYDSLLLAPGQRVALPDPEAILEYVTEPTFAYSSSDSGVLSVSGDGWLTAEAEGACELYIQVPGSDALAICAVTVTAQNALILPAALSRVEEEAFLGTGATRAVLGEQVARIGARAFADSGLAQVVIPAADVQIAADAFDGSDPLILCARDSDAQRYAEAHGLRYAFIEEEQG